MTVALVDVNVLVALIHARHIHHEAAQSWFHGLGRGRWATCPLAENGCLRIMSQHPQAAFRRTTQEVAQALGSVLSHPGHEFWPDSASILDDTLFAMKNIHSGKQLTDVYLLGLAVRRGGHLVTFDRSIPWKAVIGAKASDLKILGGPRAH